MQKDELIQIHTLLCQLRKHFESTGACPPHLFEEYESFGVTPLHIHRSKAEHKRAILLLGRDLARIVSTDEFSNPARVGERMEAFLRRLEHPALKAR